MKAKSKAPLILVFDLETLRSAGDVGGWDNIHRMGMACGVVHDSRDDEYHVYDEKDASELIAHLQKADLVVGFNHIGFDYRVLTAYTDVRLPTLPNFDILVEIKLLLGHRLKLNSIAAATLGETKSADGLQSLKWVKEGNMDLVREYCKKDVEVTKKVFEYGVREGTLYYENYGEKVEIPVDWNVDQIVRKAAGR